MSWLALLAVLAVGPPDSAPAPAATPPGPAPSAAPDPAPSVPAAPPSPAPSTSTAARPPASSLPAAPPSPAPSTSTAAPAPTFPPPASPSAAPQPPPHAGEIPDAPPRDPNDTPFMRAPNNQPQPVHLRTTPDLRRGYSSARRFAFTVAPLFASFRLEFQNRPGRTHGAGVGGEVDVQIMKWLWLRAQGSYSVHPVQEVRAEDSGGDVVLQAARGTIKAAGFGAGPVIALDLGRFVPLIEGGVGGLRVATPDGVVKGQLGEKCLDNGGCDVGLKCGAEKTCEQSIIPELYFGGAVDVHVRRHFSFGGGFRYYALLSAPGKFPVYLQASVRVVVRF
ncbi:MAG: hypothetical protein JNL82_14290 [Myxococcales bacterium]|nr:hypothetical protein [Myxococcales bacterium]